MPYDEKRILSNYLDKVRTAQKRFDMYLPLKENEKSKYLNILKEWRPLLQIILKEIVILLNKQVF